MSLRLMVPALALSLAALAQVTIDPRPKPADKSTQPKVNLRADSNLILVPVAVVDYANHPVTGLEKENFHVFDNNVEQKISAFATEDAPVAVGLVYDHSGSVGPVIRNESRATQMFLKTSNPADEYFLVTFASKPELALGMTPSTGDVGSRVYNTRSGGSTALFDGVILGMNELRKSKLNRKALLVISDGGENNSRYSKRELQKMVEESDGLIYAIGFNSTQADFPLLKWMAELSGGRAFPAKYEDFPDVAAKIGLELRNRYVLGFSAAGIPHDGKYHALRVDLAPPHGMPKLKASWRRAYIAPDDSR